MSLGKRLQELRKTSGLSQEQFGELFQVSRQSISKWESDSAQPELSKLIEVAKYYKVSLDYLLMGKKDHNSVDLEQIQKNKMLFIIGCIFIGVGVILLSVSMIVNKELFAFYGTIFNWLFMCLYGGIHDLHWILYYGMLALIICLGSFLCFKAIKDKK